MALPNQGPARRGRVGEAAALERIRAALETRAVAPAGEIWIGDDAAVVAAPQGHAVLATDAAVAGVHADLDLVGLDDLGWKAVTATVSDIAAMGATPRHALVVLCAPPGTDLDLLNAGVVQASARWDCPVVGGDLSAADQVVVVVSVVGELSPGPGPVPRSGARPGDELAVTGPVGRSAAGLAELQRRAAGGRATGGVGEAQGLQPEVAPPVSPSPAAADLVAAHRRPLARVAEGRAARLAGASAMIDVSDGLAVDLDRLALASGVGVHLDTVPVAEGATTAEALGGGEDYELLVAVPDLAHAAEAFAVAGLRPLLRVGVCTADPSERTLGSSPLPTTGWQHAF